MFGIPVGQLIDLFSVAGVLFAFWKGGMPERVAGSVVLINIAIGEAGDFLGHHGDKFIRLGNDGLAAVALLAITVAFGSPWLGGVMLFYAAQFALHSYFLVLDRPTNIYIFTVINNLNFSGVVWCLIIGTGVAWYRRADVRSQPDPYETDTLQPAP